MASSLSITSRVKLSSGNTMPSLGLGVALNSDAKDTVPIALAAGYRLIDCAQRYGNEAEVGEGVRASGVPRSEVFVTSKIMSANAGYESTLSGVEASLKAFGFDYLDLFLIHDPKSGSERRLATYRALLELRDKGKLKSMYSGVHHLEEIQKAGMELPAVNQVEIHPFCQQRPIVSWCQEHNIAVQAFCPLVRGRMDDPIIVSVAKKHNRDPAQILVRWSLQHGLVPLPKSSNPARIKSNADIYGFELDKEDMDALDSLDQGAKVSAEEEPTTLLEEAGLPEEETCEEDGPAMKLEKSHSVHQYGTYTILWDPQSPSPRFSAHRHLHSYATNVLIPDLGAKATRECREQDKRVNTAAACMQVAEPVAMRGGGASNTRRVEQAQEHVLCAAYADASPAGWPYNGLQKGAAADLGEETEESQLEPHVSLGLAYISANTLPSSLIFFPIFLVFTMQRTDTFIDDELLIPSGDGARREPSEASTEYPGDDQFGQLMLGLPDGTQESKADQTPTEPSEPTSSYRGSTTTITSNTTTTSESSTTTAIGSVVSSKRKAQSPPVGARDGVSHKRPRIDSFEDAEDSPALDDSTTESPYIIAHNVHAQACMDARGLAWGVQWELARLVSSERYKWSDLSPEALDRLKGTCKEVAPFIEDLLRSPRPQESSGNGRIFSNEFSARAPWEELDREATAFGYSEYGGLGTIPDARHPSLPEDWYGGKVAFTMRLVRPLGPDKKPLQKLSFELLQPELGSSCRFARRLGSDFIIRVRIHKDIFYDSKMLPMMMDTFKRPFVVNSLVYRFFYANKERHAFLMATNERYHHGRITQHKLTNRMSMWDFLNWCNPPEYNRFQTIAKWTARIALGLSNSVPGILLESSQICSEDDITSEAWDGVGKIPSEMDMTDGCGHINRTALEMLYSRLGHWERCPIALQVRVCGAKGLLLLHPEKAENALKDPRVWVRPSQTKIKYAPDRPLDPAHRTIEVLRAAHMRTPVRLSNESIINLAENGVPHECFRALMRASLVEAVDALVGDWQGENAMRSLWRAVWREGGVMAARQAREAAGLARVRGLRAFDVEDEDDDEEGGEGRVRSSAWWADEISGCPSSLEETVLGMLDAGFRPDEEYVLSQKLHEVTKKAIKSQVSKGRVIVPMGCSAFIVPDPTGKLKPGQIYFKSSHYNLKTPEGGLKDKVLGPALVMRNPVKLSRDVEVVNVPELEDYYDVIVFAIHGPYHLASLLGGGDYDGDKVEVIWDPDIVSTFTNADLKLSELPPDFMESFKRENKSVESVLQDISGMSIAECVREFQSYLMGSMRDSPVVGTYSGLHDNAMYAHGYNDPRTVRLAHMFCTTLDGSKTGLSVRYEVYRQDKDEFWSSRAPEWKVLKEREDRRRETSGSTVPGLQMGVTESQPLIKRGEGLGRFVMDDLWYAMERMSCEQYKRVEDVFKALSHVRDDVLTHPWREARERAVLVGEGMRAELDTIEAHVRACYEHHKEEVMDSNFTKQKIEKRQDMLRELSAEFASVPITCLYFSKNEVGRVRASYAYYYDYEHRTCPSRFPWNVAMRTLCDIKASATGRHKTMTENFYHVSEVRKSVRK
ncbi:hypothetical protein EVG20_g7698 [Dentipellis fragilis]|uniref:Uncharacterized protein n=1 Tax=Dentipellis fragilis TaxID=205917 RepID=A0A4Y9YDN1_9AGAM|nr:hypothetical protein EVG20_g7698 [Dentipellis fragilis]